MNIATAVRTVAERNGYGNRTSEISAVTGLLDLGRVAEANRYLIRQGASPRTADALVREVLDLSRDEAVVSVSPSAAGFDRAVAAETIRAFIQNGQVHVGDRGASVEDVDALLILAGLEDEPEPVAEEVDEPGLLQRLVSWAKGQGFNG